MSRRPAFDPGRLDDDFDQLLAPSTAVTALPRIDVRAINTTAEGEEATPSDKESGSLQSAAELRARPPRGAGGRPPRRTADTSATPGTDDALTSAVAAVRIPKPLYDAVVLDLLAGAVERPSYAQVVAWTCEDHFDDVIEEVRRAAARTQRSPRGRKLATEVVALTLRFRAGELAALDDVRRRVAGDEAASITRTAAVTAALRVAVKHGAATLMVQTSAGAAADRR